MIINFFKSKFTCNFLNNFLLIFSFSILLNNYFLRKMLKKKTVYFDDYFDYLYFPFIFYKY